MNKRKLKSIFARVRHVPISGSPYLYQCNICDIRFKKYRRLRRHPRKYHQDVSAGVPLVVMPLRQSELEIVAMYQTARAPKRKKRHRKYPALSPTRPVEYFTLEEPIVCGYCFDTIPAGDEARRYMGKTIGKTCHTPASKQASF